MNIETIAQDLINAQTRAPMAGFEEDGEAIAEFEFERAQSLAATKAATIAEAAAKAEGAVYMATEGLPDVHPTLADLIKSLAADLRALSAQ